MIYKNIKVQLCCMLFIFFSTGVVWSQTKITLFENTAHFVDSSPDKEVSLELNPFAQDQLRRGDLTELRIDLPLSSDTDEVLPLILHRRKIFGHGGMKVSSRSGSYHLYDNDIAFFRGKIEGREDSEVHMGIFQDQVQLRVLESNGTGYKLVSSDVESPSGQPVYELTRMIAVPPEMDFVCGNNSAAIQNQIKGTQKPLHRSAGNSSQGPLTVYLEIDYRTYVSMGGTIQDVVTQITDLFARVSGYFDGINCNLSDDNNNSFQYCVQLQLSELFIHTSTDAYAEPFDVFGRLEDFVMGSNASTNTDLSQLINYSDVNPAFGGLSNGVGSLCGGTYNPLDVNSGNPLYQNPLDMNGESIANLGPYQSGDNNNSALYEEYTMAHELGHSLGAMHTGANAFYSSDPNEPDCPGHRYALEMAPCGAIGDTRCDPVLDPNDPNFVSRDDPPREEPDDYDGMGSLGRTVDRLCPSTVMSYCAHFLSTNHDCPPGSGVQATIPVGGPFFHIENRNLICAHLDECNDWGDPPCTAPEVVGCDCSNGSTPGANWLDTDCDGIPDCCECDGYEFIAEPTFDHTIPPVFRCDGTIVPGTGITVTAQACDDNDPCTTNDMIIFDYVSCLCIGEPTNDKLADNPSSGGCINNSGLCEILDRRFDGPNASLAAVSQFPVRWTGSRITTPDIVDGQARLRGTALGSNGNITSAEQEGLVFPLCCPIKRDGSNYRLLINHSWLPHYAGLGASLLIQGSTNPPDVNSPMPTGTGSFGDVVSFGMFALSDNLTSAYPQVTVGCTFDPVTGNPLTTAVRPDDFWYLNPQSVPAAPTYTAGALNTPPFLDLSLLAPASCSLNDQEIHYLYFSVVIDPTNSNHIFQGTPLENCSGLQFFGGGSLLIDNIQLFKSEPPITLVRQTEDFSFCEGFRTEIPQPVLDSELASNDCEFMICEGEDFKLEVVAPGWTEDRPITLAEPPYCFTENNYRWERLTDDMGDEPCPPEIQTGSTFCLEDFDAMMQGRYRLTLFDPACNCENEMEFELRLDRKPDMELAYQLCYVDCLQDQADDSGQFTPGCSSFIDYDQPTGPDCALHLCMDDYWSRTLQVRPTDPQMPLDPQDIVILFYEDIFECRGIDLPEGEGPLDIVNLNRPTDCWENRTSISFDGFGTYMVYDRHCPSNPLVFVVEPDDMIDLGEVIISEEPQAGDDCEVMVCFIYNDMFPEAENHQVVQWNDGIGWSSNHSIQDDNDTWCTTLPMNEDHLIQIRWGDNPSCCEEFMYRYDNELNPNFDIDDQLCDTNNGGVEVIQPDPDWTFIWSDGSTNSFIDCLNAGDYTLTITDKYGCEHMSLHTISNITTDVLSESGQRSGLAESDANIAQTGIKLNSGTTLNWEFISQFVSDNFKIIISEDQNFPQSSTSFLLHSTPISSVSENCCLTTTSSGCQCPPSYPSSSCSCWCDCANVYLASHPSNMVDFSNYSYMGDQGVGQAIININNANECHQFNSLSGSITIPNNQQGFYWVKAEIDGQPCYPDGPDFTRWELTISCLPMMRNRTIQARELNLEFDIPFVNLSSNSSHLLIDEGSFLVYPNPSNDQINVEIKNFNDNSIVLFDTNGKKVLSKKCNNSKCVVDLSELDNAVYLLKVLGIESAALIKIIKI